MEIILIILLLFLILIILLRPGRFSAEQLNMLYGVNCAHRGLHTKDKTIPENSLAAFKAAVNSGYGIELDIQLSADGEVVVFHDDTLDRVTNGAGRVDLLTYEQLCELRLCETDEKIPLLSEVFAVVDGRVPLIIELKTGHKKTELCEKGLKLMREYTGAYCIESFDPRIVRWFHKNAPEILRGQLSSHPSEFKNEPFILAFALGNLFTNVIARPQFIAYGIGKKTVFSRLAGALGGMRVCWTSRDENSSKALENENDTVIFEFYTPNNKYK